MRPSRLLSLALFLIAPSASATVRYIATTGSDSGNCSVTACATYAYAITQASAGDDFEFANGTYTNTNNSITGFSGTSGNYTEVYCASELGCVISFTNAAVGAIEVSNDTWAYMNIHGFKLKNTGNSAGVVNITGPDQSAEANHAHDIIVSTCIAICNMATENTAGWSVAFVKNSTFTNIAIEGGRYSFLAYSCRWLRVERAFATWKSWGVGAATQNPVAGFTAYNVYDSTFSNVLVLDCKAPAPTANTSDEAGIYVVSNANATGATYDHSQNLNFYGCMVMNHRLGIGIVVEDKAVNVKFTNSAIAGVNAGGASVRLTTTATFRGITISSTGWNGTGYAIYSDASETWVNSNCAFGTGGNSGGSMTYSNFYGFDDNTNAGTGNTSVDPNFQWVFVATNTAVAGDGESGADMGATILYLYQGGVETSIPMWPWPNEGTLKTFMADASGFNYTDGLFGSADTLTSYVWKWKYNNEPPAQFASGATQGGGTTPTVTGTTIMGGFTIRNMGIIR